MATALELGAASSLWRYPVKSMMGEELNAADVTERLLRGDRACALIDRTDGKVATAKNPKKWPNMFDFRATFIDPLHVDTAAPPIRVTLPDGTFVNSDQRDCNETLSKALGRDAILKTVGPDESYRAANAEEYWPDMEGLDFRNTVTDFPLPEGTFFDCAVLHLLTTAALDRLRELYPRGRFEVRRVRPNIVIQPAAATTGFIESDWIGKTLTIGDDVRLTVSALCAWCVMTTLPQGDLPRDSDILRTAAQHNHVHVGVYAAVVRGGVIRRGDAVRKDA